MPRFWRRTHLPSYRCPAHGHGESRARLKKLIGLRIDFEMFTSITGARSRGVPSSCEVVPPDIPALSQALVGARDHAVNFVASTPHFRNLSVSDQSASWRTDQAAGASSPLSHSVSVVFQALRSNNAAAEGLRLQTSFHVLLRL